MARRNPLGDAASIILAFLGAAAAAGVVYAIAKPAAPVTKGRPAPPNKPNTPGINLPTGWAPVDISAVPQPLQLAMISAAYLPFSGGATLSNQIPGVTPTAGPPPAGVTLPANTTWLQADYTPSGSPSATTTTTYGAIVAGAAPAPVPGGPLLAGWLPGQILTWYQLMTPRVLSGAALHPTVTP